MDDKYYKLLYDVLQSYDRCTPKNISQLRSRQIFVFGTDVRGTQKYGAAGLAAKRFGAQPGVSDGITGSSYAIPTLGASFEQTKKSIAKFENFVRNNMAYQYLVTPIGCGHAGLKVENVAPLFRGLIAIANVMLPEDFIRYYRKECAAILGGGKEKESVKEEPSIFQLYDSKVHGVLKYLEENNIAFNQEGGYSLTDDEGTIIAEAELGIDSEKVIFYPFNSQSELTFKNAGYTIMDAESYLNSKKK